MPSQYKRNRQNQGEATIKEPHTSKTLHLLANGHSCAMIYAETC